MLAFSNKGIGETINYTVAFSPRMESGETISAPGSPGSNTAVIIAVSDPSSGTVDPNPSAMLNGAPQINAVPITIKTTLVPIGQAILQSLTGGVIGCTYVVTYTASISSGETIVEQVTLYVSEYVPSN